MTKWALTVMDGSPLPLQVDDIAVSLSGLNSKDGHEGVLGTCEV